MMKFLVFSRFRRVKKSVVSCFLWGMETYVFIWVALLGYIVFSCFLGGV